MFASLALAPHQPFIHHRFHRHSPSGCFFNGRNQICFFEPLFPLLYCSAGFGFVDYGGGPVDYSDEMDWAGVPQSEVTLPSADSPQGDNAAEGTSLTSADAMEAQKLDSGIFLLVLNGGATRAVSDYWVADGYLEYISPDGTRSHIPLDALDLQRTVTANSPRGIPFVLRSAPAENR